MGEYNEKLNAEDIASIQSKVLLPDAEPIHPHAKDDTFENMCDCTDKHIKFSKVLMCIKLVQLMY